MKFHYVLTFATALVLLMSMDLSEGRHRSRSSRGSRRSWNSASPCPTTAPTTAPPTTSASPMTSAPTTAAPSTAVPPTGTVTPAPGTLAPATNSTPTGVDVTALINYVFAVYFTALNSGLSAGSSCNTICTMTPNLCSGCIASNIAPIPPFPNDIFNPQVVSLG